MKVFQANDMPNDAYEEICDKQPNDSFRKIWLDNIECFPKTTEWLLANGATKEDKRVVVEICW